MESRLDDESRRWIDELGGTGGARDALVTRLGSNRDAVYKTMFDARRKLHAALVANGYVGASTTSEERERARTVERRQ
jgi:RNA polymerase sigma-70 factor, ECF subfamily